MPLWLQIALAAGTALSLAFHAAHNKKLNAIADAIDKGETFAKAAEPEK